MSFAWATCKRHVTFKLGSVIEAKLFKTKWRHQLQQSHWQNKIHTSRHKPMEQWRQHFKCQFNGELLQTTHPSPSNNLIAHIGFISLVITSLLQGPCMPQGEVIPKTRGLRGGNSQVPTLHFGNAKCLIPHPWPLPIMKHKVKSYHESKHTKITKQRRGKSPYIYSLRLGGPYTYK
jgi:hypothetical protein